MEMKQNPNALPLNEDQVPSEEDHEITESVTTQAAEGPFGPPRQHTLIREPLPLQDNISQDSSELPPFLTRFPLPPPPKFAREGRSGVIQEVNPDAELVTPEEETTRSHHIIVN